MAEKTRIPLAEAEALADEVVDLLAPVTDRIAVAGSIRRKRPDVGDLEVVAIPAVVMAEEQVDMFTTRQVAVDLLDSRCRQLRADGVFADRLDKNGRPAFGSLYKRLSYRGVALDLFSCRESNWGVILLIRSGPSAFSRAFVTQRRLGGLLPNDLRVEDGALWRGAERLSTPEEQDCFRLAGLPWLAPEQRDSWMEVRCAPA
jgi:DNA polymerase/3'-5' exonuclease PolX